jgi:hypothetical protein
VVLADIDVRPVVNAAIRSAHPATVRSRPLPSAHPTRQPKRRFEDDVSTRCDIRTECGMYGFGARSMTAQSE